MFGKIPQNITFLPIPCVPHIPFPVHVFLFLHIVFNINILFFWKEARI